MKRKIKLEYPDSWQEQFANKSKLPGILWVHYWYKLWLERTVGSRDGGALGDKSENSNSSQGLAWKGYSCSQAMLARKKVELDTMMLSRVTHPDLVQTT